MEEKVEKMVIQECQERPVRERDKEIEMEMKMEMEMVKKLQ